MFFELEPLNKCHIQIDKIGTGQSVVVTCYCPAEYTGPLIIAVLGKIDTLQRKGLKEFIVCNCTVWNNTQVKYLFLNFYYFFILYTGSE